MYISMYILYVYTLNTYSICSTYYLNLCSPYVEINVFQFDLIWDVYLACTLLSESQGHLSMPRGRLPEDDCIIDMIQYDESAFHVNIWRNVTPQMYCQVYKVVFIAVGITCDKYVLYTVFRKYNMLFLAGIICKKFVCNVFIRILQWMCEILNTQVKT